MAYNLRYFTSFYGTADTRTDDDPDLYEVNILELDGVDAPEELEASENPATITYNNSGDNKLLPLRGSVVDLNLIATESFHLENLYTENERQWLIQIDRNSSRIHNSFIIPDGCQEQFMFTPYIVSINAVDGLGLLKGFSFVQNTGDFFLGKMTWIEVIYACLNRVGVPDTDIYTCVNIYEITMTQGDAFDPLALSYVNAERFLQTDGVNPMDCQQVLEAILQEWTACIIQSEGHWWIYRPTEVALNGTLAFRHYVDGIYVDFVSKDVDALLGGYTEGPILAPLYHKNTDQLKMIAKPYKNSSISYRYGFVASLMTNPSFTGWNGIVFTDWTRSDVTIDLSEDPLGGAKIGGITGTDPPVKNIFNATMPGGTQGDILTLQINYYNYRSDGPYWQLSFFNSPTTYYLNRDGSWSTSPVLNLEASPYYFEGSFTVQTQPLPFSGPITIRLYEATDVRDIAPSTDLFVTFRKVDLVPYIDPSDPIGEIHLATQTQDFSFVPEIINVFNGDDSTSTHIGAIFREDQTTLTTLWVRRDLPESALCSPYSLEKPFLRLAVEETVRLYANPFVKFEGSIFNYFNPLSRITINLITGKFMPDSLVYNLQENTCKAVVTRVSNEEIAMDYTLQADYGEITKITIR